MDSVLSTESAVKLRAELNHPVIDVDGHHLEYLPVLDRHLRLSMGERLFSEWLAKENAVPASLVERQARRIPQPGWWTAAPATQPHDRAAAALPRLLRHRMDDLGIDFMILYTSVGLRALSEPNDELRMAFCRALNQFFADHYLVFNDRLTPAGIIPMFTPDEALRELDHCYSLGIKVVHLAHGVPRPIASLQGVHPELYPMVNWLDTYGLDSSYDYDPVWQHLCERGFAATFHGHSGHAAAAKSSRSITNYVFNHIGAHAGLMQELCKSLVLGGVTRRFSSLPFAFLEGGVHWATGLLSDFIEHWEKRNSESIESYDPRRLDPILMDQLLRRWGGEFIDDGVINALSLYANRREGPHGDTAEPQHTNDFSRCDISQRSDIATLFGNLHFGCESDDPMVSLAFRPTNSLGIGLRAMFSSDYGHWDVGLAERLLPNSYALVRNGLLSRNDFRDFTADNAIRLHGAINGRFWQGTVVEQYASEVLSHRSET